MVSRDPEKLAASLLRKSLHDSADGCPGPDILAAYFERTLDRQQSARYELHLSQCARCREQLAALDRAGAPAASASPTRWAWLWDWRWLAPVTAALIVAAVWMATRPATKKVSGELLVALSQQTPAAPATQQQGSAPSGVPQAKHTPTATKPPNAKPPLTDSLEKEKEAAARDFTAGVANLSPPSGSGNGGGMSEGKSARETARSDTATVVLQPSPMTTKSNPVPAAAGASAQRVRTDTRVTSPRLALQAVDRRIVETIPTPDPKVMLRIVAGTGVERSEDGGVSWYGELLESQTQLTAGSAPSEQICWLVGRSGVILLTTNAIDWKRVPPPVAADFVAITARDSSTATVTTADGHTFTTNDGGIHWHPTL